jgi:hypothetical protein
MASKSRQRFPWEIASSVAFPREIKAWPRVGSTKPRENVAPLPAPLRHRRPGARVCRHVPGPQGCSRRAPGRPRRRGTCHRNERVSEHRAVPRPHLEQRRTQRAGRRLVGGCCARTRHGEARRRAASDGGPKVSESLSPAGSGASRHVKTARAAAGGRCLSLRAKPRARRAAAAASLAGADRSEAAGRPRNAVPRPAAPRGWRRHPRARSTPAAPRVPEEGAWRTMPGADVACWLTRRGQRRCADVACVRFGEAKRACASQGAALAWIVRVDDA